MPWKEINFFSRERNWSRGFDWYEGLFGECAQEAVAGELSTSYLTDAQTPARIQDRYPQARLIVSLRNPVDRAYSSYLNDIVAGVLPRTATFRDALDSHPEYLEAGRYARHLRNYLELFPRDQLFVSIFDDARRDPLAAVQGIYGFLGVDPSFRPTMLGRRVGVGRVPRSQRMERLVLSTAAAFRSRRPLRSLWWTAKRLGLGDRLRALNTRGGADLPEGLDPRERRVLIDEFDSDIAALEELLDMELPGWRR